jgi:hypothetical protein
MTTFSVVRVTEITGTAQAVYKLVRDDKCLLDKFLEKINKDSNLAPELGDLTAIVKDMANLQSLPKSQCRKLRLSAKLRYAGYEVKSENLRLYLFHEKGTGQIIAFGGKKTDQREDLERFEKIIKQYAEFKKQ